MQQFEQAVEAARAEAADATLRAEAAEAALADLRAGTDLGEDAPVADIVAHALRMMDDAQSQPAERAAPAESTIELTAAQERADNSRTQLAEAEKRLSDAEAHASQLTEQLTAAQEEARAAASEAAARDDAAHAADAALYAELKEAQRQVQLSPAA